MFLALCMVHHCLESSSKNSANKKLNSDKTRRNSVINEYIRCQPCLEMSWMSINKPGRGNEKRTGQPTNESFYQKGTVDKILNIMFTTLKQCSIYNTSTLRSNVELHIRRTKLSQLPVTQLSSVERTTFDPTVELHLIGLKLQFSSSQVKFDV